MGAQRWSAERAQRWWAEQPWIVGCNFIPSTAGNQLEMWQGGGGRTRGGRRRERASPGEARRPALAGRAPPACAPPPTRGPRPLLVLSDDGGPPEPMSGPQPEPHP